MQATSPSLEKHYHGALEASGTGEMLSRRRPTGLARRDTSRSRPSTGTLDGKEGAFQPHAFGRYVRRQAPSSPVEVVPGSGTAALVGIAGEMKIDAASDGKHTYNLSYTLPDPQA